MKRKKPLLYVPVPREPFEPQRKILESVVEILTGEPKSEDELISFVNKADAVLLVSIVKMTRKVIEASPNLRLIAKYGVGVENIDVDAATEKGIPVTYVPAVNSNAVAEMTIGLIFAVMRRIQEAREHIQKGQWRNDLLIGRELLGRTIGIIGYGNVAKRVIRKLQGLEVREILVFTESKAHEILEFSNVRFVDLETLLRTSDIISIHKTLTPSSKGLIGEQSLQRMRKTAYLVNLSRGGLIEETALIKALREGWIAGAALDVYEREPLAQDSPFLSMQNVVLTPHIGASTAESREKMVTTVAGNIVDFFKGK